MSKPRLLIPILTHFVVRYILRTGMLEKLSEFVDPVIGISWNDPELINEFQNLGAEVIDIPSFKFGNDFRILRARVNSWHRVFRKTPTTKLINRSEFLGLDSKEKIRSTLQSLEYSFLLKLPGSLLRLQNDYEKYLWKDSNVKEFENLLLKTNPDAILSITPFVNREEPLLRAAKRNNIKCYTSILSFDNITTRSWIPIKFDHYLVWNKHNANQFIRGYPDIKENEITVTGPPQFDSYYDKSFFWDEKDWRTRLNIPEERPVILFGGGTYQLIPNEPYWLGQLDEDISLGKIPNNPIILFRRHPGDINERWESVLKNARNIALDQPWQAKEKGGQINITRQNIENLSSTLMHSQVHINTCSTLTVDGSVFNRPQIGPAYDAEKTKKLDRTLRDLYKREHFLPITNSGGLDIVRSREEMNMAITTAIESPELMQEGRKKIVQEICTFSDGNCSDRVVETMKKLMD